MDAFVDPPFRNHINNVVRSIFPRLAEAPLLADRAAEAIEYTAARFCFDMTQKARYQQQFFNNNSRDIKSVVNMLVPYIDDMAGSYQLHRQLTTLADISTLPGVCNVQHDRHLGPRGEYRYSARDVEHNFKLLLDTINAVSNKLYVNWDTVVPMSLERYRGSRLWQTSYRFDEASKAFVDPKGVVLGTDMFRRDYRGLHPYDIFNALYHHLFLQVLPYKWLMYEKLVKEGSRPVLFIEALDEFIPLSLLTSDMSWSLLQDAEKSRVLSGWRALLRSAEGVTVGSSARDMLHFVMVKNIALHYEKYYKEERHDAIFKVRSLDDLEEREDGNQVRRYEPEVNYTIEGMSNTDFVRKVAALELSEVFEFLRSSVRDFGKTWFGKRIMALKRGHLEEFEVSGRKYVLSFKHIYNYAKGLCIRHGTIKTEARCLSEEAWKDFTEKLNGGTAWFRIPNNLMHTYGLVYGDAPRKDATAICQELDLRIRRRLMDIVFETHIIQGALVEVQPSGKPLADATRALYQKCFYYLTNEPYENMRPYGDEDYLTWLAKSPRAWYKYYAMDWVFQVSFFHRFLNNRVMYVTGATGQGKSTQVPKLLYYATKVLAFVAQPRVISTQPRRAPTVDNARTIAEELGVPIAVGSGKCTYKTFSGHVQYSTKEDKHQPADARAFLREVTDKTLLDEMLGNPFLKGPDGARNLYDVVIVDEAHEHNPNMDLILTLMQTSLFYNNQLRLVITSATMQIDEPNYRAFYRPIDDNLMFPLSVPLKERGLDRIAVDRRVHISAPGETTRWKVTDVWNGRDPVDYKDSERMAIAKALEIAGNNKTGDVLLFSIGEAEVTSICKELNAQLPSHAIALPFYSKLDPLWQEVAKTPSLRSKRLNFDKTQLFEEIRTEGSATRTGASYTMVIIVATNIAEASLTVPGLTYVIETGFVKAFPFDAFTRSTVQRVTNINEMNRIQRRGRVGRVGNGTVYYMYSESYLKKVPFRYSICESDFTTTLFSLLSTTRDEAYPTSLYIHRWTKPWSEWEATAKGSRIYKILKAQMFHDDKPFVYAGDVAIRNTSVLAVPRRMIDGGYAFDDLYDDKGVLYLIHPSEDMFRREPLGRQPIPEIPRAKMETFVKSAYNKDYIHPRTIEKNMLIHRIQKLGMAMSVVLTEDEQLNIALVRTLLHAVKHKCVDEVMRAVAWISVVGSNWDKVLSRYPYKHATSDLLTLLHVSQVARPGGFKVPNLLPSKDMVRKFVAWRRNLDWNRPPFDPKTTELLAEHLTRGKVAFGTVDFAKPDLSKQYVEEGTMSRFFDRYMAMAFGWRMRDSPDLKAHPMASAFRKLETEARELQVISSESVEANVLRSFLGGFPGQLLQCDEDGCRRLPGGQVVEGRPPGRRSGLLLYLIESTDRDGNVQYLYSSNVRPEWVVEAQPHTRWREEPVSRADNMLRVAHARSR
jgi:hypothetical protein